jgi:prephenate dehydrogenase
MFKKVLVFGLGLLGGAICKSLRKQYPDIDITACGRSLERMQQALNEKVINNALLYDDDIPDDVDLIVVAVPVKKSIEIIRNILNSSSLKKSAIVIDVGSVKEEIVGALFDHPRSDRFIACHPMAGSEKSGYSASYSSLYNESTVIITPHSKNIQSEIDKIEKFWQDMGAKCINVSAKEHDKFVALTSHLPHMLACSLVNYIGRKAELCRIKPFIGSGFKDVTRIAEGSVDMWREISELNSGNIITSIDEYIDILKYLKKAICESNNQNDITSFLESSGKIRREIVN